MKKKGIYTVLLLTCGMLAGCGKKQANTNLLEGMNCIEELNYQSALEAFSQGHISDEDAELLYRGEGIAYMGLSQYENARDAFLQSIKNASASVSPLEIDTNFYLASAWYKLGEYDEASKIYSSILKYKEKDIDAFFLRGCCFLKTGDYENAMKDFSKAFSMEPENMDLVIDTYEELIGAGFTSEGAELLQGRMDTDFTKLTPSQKGTLYFYLENYDEARIYLEQAVAKGDKEMSLLLGRTYEKLGDMNYAGIVYQGYIDYKDDNPEVYNNLGICLMTQGKVLDALEIFEKGIELGNSNVTQNLKFNQIVAYERNANFSIAKQLMEEYIRFYPDDAKALREYEFLKSR